MVVKLYGFNPMLFFICKEFGIPYEAVTVSMATGEHKSPEWLETMQPFGQIPVLDDDGFKVYESRAIARYLVRKYKPESSFVPTTDDLQKYALFEQAMSIEAFNFSAILLGLVHEQHTKLNDASAAKERSAEHLKKVEEKLDVYERILSKQKYLAGDDFTLADAAHLYYGSALEKWMDMHIFSDASKRPKVASWYEDMTSRPAWKEVDVQYTAYTAAVKAARAAKAEAEAEKSQ